jgi:hypothetical protein
MALLSEQLVEEYYNRQRYLTIRGAKQGVGESDILAIRYSEPSCEALHIEVQTSFRPVAYLSNGNAGAGNRSNTQVEAEMATWFEKKFTSRNKVRLRESVWPKAEWNFVFVHGRMKDSRELDFLTKHHVELICFSKILRGVTEKVRRGGFTASSGGDLAEILRYHREEN